MTHIQPQSATTFEIAIDESVAPEARVASSIPEIRRLKLVTRPSGLLPFLIYEYGLEPLSRYLPNLYDLIDQGRQWERYRGTHKAIHDGLGFIGYTAQIINPPARRLAWADFQLHLGRLRDNEGDLVNIDGIVTLSSPVRSKLRRVFFGHDFPAAEGGYTTHGNCIWGDDSGVRIAGSDVKWSFGRTHDVSAAFTESELTALGIWIEPVASNYWALNDTIWADDEFLWADPAEQSRRSTIADAFLPFPVWMRFDDAVGDTIGFRLARSLPIAAKASGPIVINGARYAINRVSPTHIYAYAHTGFGDGNGSVAASVALVANGTVSEAPGRLWRTDVAGGVEIAPTPLPIEFGQTVRDKVQMLLELA
jgi:hypothetical protein